MQLSEWGFGWIRLIKRIFLIEAIYNLFKTFFHSQIHSIILIFSNPRSDKLLLDKSCKLVCRISE